MKKLAFVVIMLMTVSFAACGSGGSSTPATQADKENAQQLFDEVGLITAEFQHWVESGVVTQYLSSCAWGAGNASASCNCTDSGTFSATGDQTNFTMTFTNCNGITGSVNGTSSAGGPTTYSTNGLANSNCQALSFDVEVIQNEGCSGTVDGTCNGSLSGTFGEAPGGCLITWN